MNRVIGIQHRVKRNADGEARPTQVAFSIGGHITKLELRTEQDELDFVTRNLPIRWRKPAEEEDVSGIPFRHLRTTKVAADQVADHPSGLILKLDKQDYVVTGVPEAYEGLQSGDSVAMVLGGSGDLLAYALAVQGEQIGAKVYRIAPFKFKAARGSSNKEDDAALLADHLLTNESDFYLFSPRDRGLVKLIQSQRAREEAMKARVACEQRLRQNYIGNAMLGIYPQGDIEKEFAAAKANDTILSGLLAEESMRDRELAKAANALDVYCEVFDPITGMGPAIAARIIAAVGDVRRFWVLPDETEMARLHDASKEIQQQYYDPIVPEVKAQFTPEMTIWDKLNVAKQHYNRKGNTQAVKALQKAMDSHHERSKLKKQARQKSVAKFRAFCGVHVLDNGTFPRRRNNEVANWNPLARQAFYLAGEQFVRRADSVWGQRYRALKARYRQKHPEPIVGANGAKKYTDGHIHKMAYWAAIGEFAEYVYDQWSKLYA